MKKSFSFIVFIVLALLFVMPPGNTRADNTKMQKSEIVDQTNLDQIQPFFAPDVEVIVSSCASCTGESWVDQPLTVFIIANEEIISPKHYCILLLVFDSDKMNGLKSNKNIKGYGQCDIEYSMRFTC